MIELLAPAGSLEKMNLALRYGADAVYFGLPDFSLRARSNQFTKNDIIEAQKQCEKYDKKFYITMNIYAHNIHLKKIKEQLQWLSSQKIYPDGIIVADPGIVRLIKRYLPKVDIHLSTQANATNLEAVKFWQEIGVKRVVLARETTLDEITEIHQAVPKMELEVFVQGAMCMSYSGRCILSKWMTNRSANLGDCAQPCRWKWQEQSVQENYNSKCLSCSAEGDRLDLVDSQKRFGMKVEEDQHGTYMFNSYDISLIEHLDKLIKAGVVSFKIEGRAKSIYYLAVIVKTYRQVLNCLISGADCSFLIKKSVTELDKMSNRGYWTGFIFGDEPPHLFDKAYLPVKWEFVGLSEELHSGIINDENRSETQKKGERVSLANNEKIIFVHNKLMPGDKVEIIGIRDNLFRKIVSIKNEEGVVVKSAHGGLGKLFRVKFNKEVPSIFLLRKKM